MNNYPLCKHFYFVTILKGIHHFIIVIFHRNNKRQFVFSFEQSSNYFHHPNRIWQKCTYLMEFAALDGFVKREFCRLGIFFRLNDMRLRNCRKSKFRIDSMVDCLKNEMHIENNWWTELRWKSVEWTSFEVNYFWKIVGSNANKSIRLHTDGS